MVLALVRSFCTGLLHYSVYITTTTKELYNQFLPLQWYWYVAVPVTVTTSSYGPTPEV